MKKHDVTIIGSGPGGYVAAIKAAQLGLNTAIIEKEAIGGVCLNWGCIPTKALLKSAKVYNMIKNAKAYGIKVDASTIQLDFKSVMKRKNIAVKKLTGGVGFLLKKNNVTVYEGEATVKDAHTVQVNDEIIETKKLIIATGASPAFPPIEGLKQGYEKNNVLTSKEILDLEAVPQELVIIGGGVIGVEFATMFNAFGTKVTILERENDILLEVDQEIKEVFKKKLKKDGITILTEANVKAFNNGEVSYEHENETKTLKTDKVLLAAGMRPNLKGLEALNLETTSLGIKTDEYMRTNLEDVYAIGDVNGKYMLAHVASKEGVVAAMHINNHEEKMQYDIIPSGIYTFPEIAQVGMTEEQAKQKNIDYKTATFPLSANGKALAEGEKDGLVKLIADIKYNEVIGVHILASSATEMISESVLGMTLQATANDIVNTIHPHPTLSEMMHEVAHGIVDKPIHI